jgi:hypothetical protein
MVLGLLQSGPLRRMCASWSLLGAGDVDYPVFNVHIAERKRLLSSMWVGSTNSRGAAFAMFQHLMLLIWA